ncbi:hypothetical protein [Metabacillus endolithicus]|uniref:Uncharacterized protein n=1 Tax=Metabacillus endolithicus TaxID=1535204 RepID=A0ABW5C1R1_9BACI|nr:hypothetical protein [Metabacillus endolithicus]UPG66036.1 hypothetical protein MVE64_26700 [Metabacillus endolithicus]
MRNETYLDFCFIREKQGEFSQEIHNLFSKIFVGKRLNWYLDEKKVDGLEVIVAEVKGLSDWESEEELIDYLDENADNLFWTYLQGYQLSIFSDKKGCQSCGTH